MNLICAPVLLLKFHCNFKQYFRKHRIILICYGITCKECMDTKFFAPFAFRILNASNNLFCCHSVFCISRIIHDIIADLEHSARIVTTADQSPEYFRLLFLRKSICVISSRLMIAFSLSAVRILLQVYHWKKT